MRTTPLHRDFGVEVHDVSLKEITATQGYDELRRLFEEHSLLLFRDQDLSDEAQLEFGALFGPLEDRHDRPKPEISPVANLDAAGAVIASDADTHVKNLRRKLAKNGVEECIHSVLCFCFFLQKSSFAKLFSKSNLFHFPKLSVVIRFNLSMIQYR